MNAITITILQSIVATKTWVQGRVSSNRGAAAVEYGLLVGLIAAVIVGVVAILGGNLSSIFSGTSNSICNGVHSANTAVTCTTTN